MQSMTLEVRLTRNYSKALTRNKVFYPTQPKPKTPMYSQMSKIKKRQRVGRRSPL